MYKRKTNVILLWSLTEEGIVSVLLLIFIIYIHFYFFTFFRDVVNPRGLGRGRGGCSQGVGIAHRVLEGSHGFEVKYGNLSELL